MIYIIINPFLTSNFSLRYHKSFIFKLMLIYTDLSVYVNVTLHVRVSIAVYFNYIN